MRGYVIDTSEFPIEDKKNLQLCIEKCRDDIYCFYMTHREVMYPDINMIAKEYEYDDVSPHLSSINYSLDASEQVYMLKV